MGQPLYTERILRKYGMQDSKAVDMPVVKLIANEKSNDVCNQQLYQVVVGSLLYHSTKTRPDIAYAVSCVARFCPNPTKEHQTAVKRILRFLKGISNLKEQTPHMKSGDIGDRKSTSGYVFLLEGVAISWKGSKQTCVALSTAEAEYVALCAAVQEAMWFQQLVSDLLNKSMQKTIIFEDNQSAIFLAKIQQVHGRTKHIDIKHHFIRDIVETGRTDIVYCASEDMVADMLTKELSAKQFEKLRRRRTPLRVRSSHFVSYWLALLVELLLEYSKVGCFATCLLSLSATFNGYLTNNRGQPDTMLFLQGSIQGTREPSKTLFTEGGGRLQPLSCF